MIRNADLMSYLPGILQNVREYTVIMNAENPEFQKVFDNSEVLIDDLFITTATIEGLKRFEKILNIKPSSQDTVNTRRFRVLSRWNDRIPYTWKALLEKLDTLCGEDNYTILLENEIYTLNLETHLGVYGTVDELNIMLDEIIPSNLVIVTNNVLYGGDEVSIYCGSAISSGLHYVLSSDIDVQYSPEANLLISSAVSKGSGYQLSSDIETSITSSGTVTGANVSVVGSHIEIS